MPDEVGLRAQAERLGLTLTDDDLAAIAAILEKCRTATEPLRPERTDGLEPSYVFTPIRPPDERGLQAPMSR